MLCFFPYAMYVAFAFQKSPKSVNKVIYYSYMTSGTLSKPEPKA